MADYTDEQLDEIRERSTQELLREPIILSAYADDHFLNFRLGGNALGGVIVCVPIKSLDALRGATAKQADKMRITKSGNAVHWPELDVQMSTIALLEIVTGLRSIRSAQAKGGASRSERKAATARLNGKAGGRPRKVA